MNTYTQHLHLCLQAAEEDVNAVLWHVPIQVSQVGVESDKSAERDPRSAALLILCQDLTGDLQRTQEGLRKT